MKTINEYASQLECCGIAAHTATRIVCDFLKEYSLNDLEIFINSIKEEVYHVDSVQC